MLPQVFSPLVFIIIALGKRLLKRSRSVKTVKSTRCSVCMHVCMRVCMHVCRDLVKKLSRVAWFNAALFITLTCSFVRFN